jgi:hypothetical protein
MRRKEIKFTLIQPELRYAALEPVPAQKELPEWYKEIDSYSGADGNKFVGQAGTIKKCIPILDSLSTGYLIKTWTDILVKDLEDGNKDFSWSIERSGLQAVEGHPLDQVYNYPVPPEYSKHVIKFINPWHIKTPPGYSCLFVQPPHRKNLPFQIFPAVVDTDTFPLTINFPAHIKEDFSGVIPYGTPIAQVIPFKRDSFKSSIGIDEDGKNQGLMLNKHETVYVNRYKKYWWHRKEYK